jgi:hypothetical protein
MRRCREEGGGWGWREQGSRPGWRGRDRPTGRAQEPKHLSNKPAHRGPNGSLAGVRAPVSKPQPNLSPNPALTSRSSLARVMISARSASSRRSFLTSFFRVRSYSANTSSAPNCGSRAAGRGAAVVKANQAGFLAFGCLPKQAAESRGVKRGAGGSGMSRFTAAAAAPHREHEALACDLGGELHTLLLSHGPDECRAFLALRAPCDADLHAVSNLKGAGAAGGGGGAAGVVVLGAARRPSCCSPEGNDALARNAKHQPPLRATSWRNSAAGRNMGQLPRAP